MIKFERSQNDVNKPKLEQIKITDTIGRIVLSYKKLTEKAAKAPHVNMIVPNSADALPALADWCAREPTLEFGKTTPMVETIKNNGTVIP